MFAQSKVVRLPASKGIPFAQSVAASVMTCSLTPIVNLSPDVPIVGWSGRYAVYRT